MITFKNWKMWLNVIELEKNNYIAYIIKITNIRRLKSVNAKL